MKKTFVLLFALLLCVVSLAQGQEADTVSVDDLLDRFLTSDDPDTLPDPPPDPAAVEEEIFLGFIHIGHKPPQNYPFSWWVIEFTEGPLFEANLHLLEYWHTGFRTIPLGTVVNVPGGRDTLRAGEGPTHVAARFLQKAMSCQTEQSDSSCLIWRQRYEERVELSDSLKTLLEEERNALVGHILVPNAMFLVLIFCSASGILFVPMLLFQNSSLKKELAALQQAHPGGSEPSQST